MRFIKASKEGEAALSELRVSAKRWISRSKHLIDALHKIRPLRDVTLIPSLLSYLLDSDREVAMEAVITIEALLKVVSTASLPTLDEYLRGGSTWGASSAWDALTPKQLSTLDLGTCRGTALLLASCHYNGYVRQSALQQLDQEESSEREIPHFLLRLNDWVIPVRNAAEQAIGSRIVSAHSGQFLAHLALVARLSARSRVASTSALRKIAELLAEDLPALISTAAAARDRVTWRFATGIAWDAAKGDSIQQSALLETMIRGKEPRSRFQVGVWLTAPDAPADLAYTFLPRLLADSLPHARCLALGWSAAKQTGGHSAALRDGLLDRSRKVRAVAQFYLPRQEAFDVAGFYREAALHGSGHDLIVAIEGLGETGAKGDAQLVAPHASSALVAVRKAAIRALAQLDPVSHRELFLELLQDAKPGVSRQARLALQPAAMSLSPEKLERVVRGTQYAHVRRQSLLLVRRLSKWDSVRLLVEIISETEEADPAHTLATSHLDAWFRDYNRTHQVQPTSSQVETLGDTLARNANRLNRKYVAELTALVVHFRV